MYILQNDNHTQFNHRTFWLFPVWAVTKKAAMNYEQVLYDKVSIRHFWCWV